MIVNKSDKINYVLTWTCYNNRTIQYLDYPMNTILDFQYINANKPANEMLCMYMLSHNWI